MNPIVAKKKIIVNLLAWLGFLFLIFGVNLLSEQTTNGHLNPLTALSRLIEPKILGLQVVALLMVMGILAIVLNRAGERVESADTPSPLQLAVEEIASLLTNYGSILFATAIAILYSYEAKSTGLWKFLATLLGSFLVYSMSYLLVTRKKGKTRTQIWTALYPAMPDVKETFTLVRDSSEITGTIVPASGPDLGRQYFLRANYRERLVSGTFDTASDGAMERGAFLLRMSETADQMNGQVVYWHDEEEILCREIKLRLIDG